VQAPHDKLFHFTFQHVHHVRGWLRSALPPAIATDIDWTELAKVHERFAGVRLRPHFADLVFVAPLRSRPQPLLILVEHKSQFDPDLNLQLLRYSIHLQRCLQASPGAQPPVLAVLLQHGRPQTTRGPGVAAASDALASYQPRQRLVVDRLTAMSEEAIRARRLSPLSELSLLCLSQLPDMQPHQIPDAFGRWQELLRAVDRTSSEPEAPPQGADAIDAIGWYTLAVTDVDSLRLSETFAQILHRPEDTIMSTLERTYQKGKAEGKAQGHAELLLRQFSKRFGPLDDNTIAHVQRGSTADLERWADRVLTAQSLGEVLAQPNDV